MQTKCRFYTRERRTLRYRAVPSKRGHQKALQICVSFESCDAQNSQESDRMTAGESGEGIRVENINYSIIMCDAQWEKEGRRREEEEVEPECVCGSGRTLYDSNDWFVERTYPKGLLKSFELLTPADTEALKRGRTMKKKKQKNSKQRKILFVCHRII